MSRKEEHLYQHCVPLCALILSNVSSDGLVMGDVNRVTRKGDKTSVLPLIMASSTVTYTSLDCKTTIAGKVSALLTPIPFIFEPRLDSF